MYNKYDGGVVFFFSVVQTCQLQAYYAYHTHFPRNGLLTTFKIMSLLTSRKISPLLVQKRLPVKSKQKSTCNFCKRLSLFIAV